MYHVLDREGVYLWQRLKDTAQIGDEIDISPYGSEKTYCVKVAGYFRSVLSTSMVMTDMYAQDIGIDFRVSSIFTNLLPKIFLSMMR